MKLSFSTLGCPDWTIERILALAVEAGYQGVELRFVEGEDALWKLPVFHGSGLAETTKRIAGCGLEISCVDTSCFFHFSERSLRMAAIEDGKRMADLAVQLGAPGVRVFGDRVQPGADRASNAAWISQAIQLLAEAVRPAGIEVWLETHGDFASSSASLQLLQAAGVSNTGIVWDPANCLAEHHESPRDAIAALDSCLRLVHLKDQVQVLREGQRPEETTAWQPVLMGHGTMPLREIVNLLQQRRYAGFVSFEWEKKWHPNIPDAALAIPHFAAWIRECLSTLE